MISGEIRNNNAYKKIGVFRALHLGDLLCSVPAFRALRLARPESEIILIGLPWAKDFARRFANIFARFIEFPGFPGLAEQAFELEPFIDFVRLTNHEKFDLLIQMHGSGNVTNPLVSMLGARETYGFCEPGTRWAESPAFIRYPAELPEVHRHLELMRHLDIPPAGTHIDIPVSEPEKAEFYQIARDRRLELGRYICIHPGGRNASRRWSPDGFAAIARDLIAAGYQVVLTGTNSEREIVSSIHARLPGGAINLVGSTSLGALAQVVRNARLLISNDTGVSHVASAVSTPSVVMFVGSDPCRWAPLDRRLHRVVSREETADIETVQRHVDEMLGTDYSREAL